MSFGQELPVSPARTHSDNEHDDTNSQSSQEIIDSKPTSPSHSTTAEDDLKNLNFTEQDISSSDDGGRETEADTEPGLFKDPESIQANSADIQEFSRLAESLSLFASCLIVPRLPSPPASPDKSRSTHNLHLNVSIDPFTDADKTEAEFGADLLELIQDPSHKGNSELIQGIGNLMRNWKGLHEGLERWRAEKKGERVRKMYKLEREG
ncbi:hypothetical protein ONS96_012071 [Cadophora gregata f. sp. sojae]|nr:hypothetical protein ONS96_012071 [Cadophora gregata f. sp. sojae]